MYVYAKRSIFCVFFFHFMTSIVTNDFYLSAKSARVCESVSSVRFVMPTIPKHSRVTSLYLLAVMGNSCIFFMIIILRIYRMSFDFRENCNTFAHRSTRSTLQFLHISRSNEIPTHVASKWAGAWMYSHSLSTHTYRQTKKKVKVIEHSSLDAEPHNTSQNHSHIRTMKNFPLKSHCVGYGCCALPKCAVQLRFSVENYAESVQHAPSASIHMHTAINYK